MPSDGLSNSVGDGLPISAHLIARDRGNCGPQERCGLPWTVQARPGGRYWPSMAISRVQRLPLAAWFGTGALIT